jgi:hypothetical protein
MKTILQSVACAALAIASCAMAAQSSAPVNVLNKNANWKSDLKACQADVATNLVASSVAESRSTTAVCEVIENSITCRDVRPSASSLNTAAEARPSMANDDNQNRQSMLARCLGDKGWRDQ